MATRKQYLGRLRRWTRKNPGTHKRTLMMKKCGKRCFLGTRKSFPICNPDCSVNPGGVQAAYIRAREMKRLALQKSISKHNPEYYQRVASRARKMLYGK